ncbi:helix-turn-helix transcriptional regulator [Aquimarina sp. U1-2]|uniref:helix-turn-helix transcriptional regulator n=1 Tax=Aquimarina sp. U1-2 TaxID=2823141 RepID=UPI001AECACA5|nr:helix-turn-helix transcriptional regulator [Aquimarina sp. U1-2]MBP2831747.1 helix-turn-helix transcriptional regulator [Aquimarina sp. U1-2]
MNVIIKQIELIKRIDQLIYLRATGSPSELANRLEISKTKLYRTIRTMRELNAPVIYDVASQSFVYEKAVSFRVGFFNTEGTTNQIHSFRG